MSEDKQVNQPQNDVQEAEVKQTQTDEKPTPTFNQEDVDRIVKQRLEAEKSKHQRMLDEAKKQEQELAREKEIQEAKTKADLENLMKQRIADKDKELADWKAKVKTINVDNYISSIDEQDIEIAGMQKIRLTFGTSKKMKKIGQLNLFYRFEHEFNKYPYSYIEMNDWSTLSHGPIDIKNWHIIGINFNFKL